MLKELFDAIVEQAKEVNEIQTHKPAAEPGHIYLIKGADGTVSQREAEPQPRQHKAADLSAIVQFAEHFATEEQPVAVWYSRSGVTCYIDDNTRRDRVDLPLMPSPQIAVLGRLAGSLCWMAQQEFIRLLRIELAGCVPVSLLPIIRKLKFRELTNAESQLTQGKQSIGRSLERELTGAGALPEDVPVNVPVWQGFQAERPYLVSCVTDIDPGTERFALVPLPGAIERAYRQAEGVLGAMLGQQLKDLEHVSLYYGCP